MAERGLQMEKVKWDLIDIEVYKDWATKLGFNVREIEIDLMHNPEKSEHEHFAEKILNCVSWGDCIQEIPEAKPGQNVVELRGFTSDKLKQLDKRLYDFWNVVSFYWQERDDLNERQLNKRIKMLNNALEPKHLKDIHQ